ncbi:MAG: pur operon repressor [Atopostipes suicloacalis]|nr:pur operon repressor [Atopostipes suicloacalis]MDN6731416.1 pur operon repressor [Atopostipes suicloacalis]
MKIKRSERLVDMTIYFLQNPKKIVPLNFFTEKYQAAKSSVSEDLTILANVFEEKSMGLLVTYAGARGGVEYQPEIGKNKLKSELEKIKNEINHSKRLLPGGYIYTSDLLGDPEWLKRIGKIISSAFVNKEIDAIMTISTKGIPIAQAVAYQLNIPFVIVRKSSKITEGSTVSINYQPRSSSQEVEKMALSRTSLKAGSRLLLIDDFLRGGGTMTGLKRMAEEFECEVVDSLVFLEHGSDSPSQDYLSLLKIKSIDEKNLQIEVGFGNFLSSLKEY